MEQFDQLLTCAICLDRYRNPKLLPCQHSFCMEPCMEGLVDYVRRQVKCPECRAEHRIPYQGVQAFPTNVTLQRFLELHIDLTGELPDPLSNQIMERCQICSEKAYCNHCAHCEKKVCPDCKDAHMDVLKREISRISNQVRRVMHRLDDALCIAEKNAMQVQGNSVSVIEEIDDIYRRLSKALRDRTEYLKHEVERYLANELKQLSSFRNNMEQEVANIQSNCELVEKYMLAENGLSPVTWQDNELMDTKDIFLKTMDFIRNLEYEPLDHSRRIRFNLSQDPVTLGVTLGNMGELHLPPHQQPTIGNGSGMGNTGNATGHGSSPNNQGQGSALMRSKSDHRLTTQFRGRDVDDDDCCSVSGFGTGRKFGDQRPARNYGQDDDSSCGSERRTRFRSRFTRHLDSSFEEPEPPQGNRVRFETAPVKERERVLDTEDVTRGPISGITRLFDSPKVIQRVAEAERPPKPVAPVQPPMVPQMQQPQTVVQKVTVPPPVAPAAPWRTPRQMSEEDEIAKQKKANKEAEKVGVRRQASTEPKAPSFTEDHPPETQTTTVQQQQQEVTQQTPRVRKLSPERYPKNRSESEDSGSSESASSSGSGSSPVGTGAIFSTEEVKARFMSKSDGPNTTSGPGRKDSTSSVASSTTGGSGNATTRPRFQSRFLNKSDKTVEAAKEESSESSSSSESESEEESDSPPAPPPKKTLPEVKSKMEKTDIGPLLARSANARDNPSNHPSLTPSSIYSSRKRIEEPPAPQPAQPPSSLSAFRRNRVTSPPVRETTDRYGTSRDINPSSTTTSATSRYPSSYTSSATDYSPSSGLARSRTGTSLYTTPTEDTSSSRYSSGLASKYLNRSRHSFDVDDHPAPTSRYGSSTTTSSAAAPTTRRSYLSKNTADKEPSSKSSRLSNMKDRRARINRSKSSHDVLSGIDMNDDDDDVEGPKPSYNLYQRRKSSTGENEYKATVSSEDSSSLSSWARYLKNKYGKDRPAPAPTTQRSPVDEAPKFNFVTNQYICKKKLLFKFGSRGSDPGYFTWPRGIASGPDGAIVVADSSNHRVQVFDGTSFNFIKEFGGYGSGEGEFDCLAGVAVNRIGQFIISDRYNHRIQIFDPSGNFLRSWGGQGSIDGKFNYPWGVCTDALGFIYVIDKENSRVQVFQSDGTFVGKFGNLGSKPGELDHPHYIAVTSTNRVVVSDTNNHRISIFDVNGKFLSSFGTEGSEEGQFKLPRGVAVDDGYIFVGDSGNNRIQIFDERGSRVISSFGTWGSGDAEFKGMEGLAVSPNGNILVCDRENHRIQIF